MATLNELFDMRNDSALRNRVAAAGWNAAKDIFVEDVGTPNHAERLVWAVKALRDDGTGSYKVVLTVYDSININGIVWDTFKCGAE